MNYLVRERDVVLSMCNHFFLEKRISSYPKSGNKTTFSSWEIIIVMVTMFFCPKDIKFEEFDQFFLKHTTQFETT